MSVEVIARRYASALADAVLETGETETVRSELKQWELMMRENPVVSTTFRNPSFTHAQKNNIIENLIQKTNPSKTTANFLRVLAQNGRVAEIPQINARLATVLQERQGGISAKVQAARPLSDIEKQELLFNLEKMTGKKVSMEFSVDPKLIGGVVTTIGSTVYDASVKTRLENLRQELING